MVKAAQTTSRNVVFVLVNHFPCFEKKKMVLNINSLNLNAGVYLFTVWVQVFVVVRCCCTRCQVGSEKTNEREQHLLGANCVLRFLTHFCRISHFRPILWWHLLKLTRFWCFRFWYFSPRYRLGRQFRLAAGHVRRSHLTDHLEICFILLKYFFECFDFLYVYKNWLEFLNFTAFKIVLTII